MSDDRRCARTPSVGVFHPGTQRSAHTAWILDQNDMLAWYATGIYYDPEAGHPFLDRLPCGLRANLHRELMRRHLPALDTAKVRSLGSWEWAVVGAGRLGASRATISRLVARRNRSLGRRVARWLDGLDVLYSYNSVALTAFGLARKRGVFCVLDQTTPVLRTWRRIMREEHELAPPEWRPRAVFDARGREMEGSFGFARHDEEEIEELATADLVICGSEFCADSVRQVARTRRPIEVQPYGVDVSAFRPGAANRDRSGLKLLMVGNIQAEKGIRYLLEATRLLRIPGLKVRLVGHKNVPDAALAPYEDLVEHVPHVPKVEVPAQYVAGDVYVLPTLIEGSSNTVYEAMACGLPVVTTPNAGSVVRDGQEGFIVPIRDPEAVAERVQQLYDNATLRREMGEAARHRAQEFTWDNYGRRIAHAISTAWADRQARPEPNP